SNLEKGIVLISSNGNKITGNTANSNYWNGITLWASNGNEVKDNTARNNTYAMVVSYSEDNTFSGNVTMRRIYYLLPVVLVYFGIVAYFIEMKFFALLLPAPK
ncbi:MAG: right-handed parallel beta-helix repeat-containing protein, partial [Deltaproteobacteria bacterium]|nr:right-handed parallel beta-helix repeat-containing protein [Deltaproteobacteria bacterium]